MDVKKRISLRVKPDIMAKFRYVAKQEGRPANQQLVAGIREEAALFEARHGEIKPGLPGGGKGGLVCKTVRIPTRYLEKLDQVAAERQVSFNEVVVGIIETCLRAAEGAEKE